MSGKVQKAGTNGRSLIVMYLAVVEIHHCAAARNVKASARPTSFIVMYLAVVERHVAAIDAQPRTVISLIVMDLAVVEIHHCATVRNQKASALPSKEGEMSGQLHPTG